MRVHCLYDAMKHQIVKKLLVTSSTRTICNWPLSNCVKRKTTKSRLRGKFAFFFVCTKDIANLSSLPQICSFILTQLRKWPIGFGLASHWLKNQHENFQPITKRSNCDYVITFDSQLKTFPSNLHRTCHINICRYVLTEACVLFYLNCEIAS